jgi:anti-sigma regulatory factor (Ser/Thr protein kinase)
MGTLSLFADLSQLAAIREFVAQSGRDLNLDEKTIYELQLAVDEASTNVVKHAYGGLGGEIEITIEPTESSVRVIVRDWGAPFDPLDVPEPDVSAPLGQRKLGGLGLFLIRQVMDDVRFSFDAEQGNTLTMEKQLRGRGGNGWT